MSRAVFLDLNGTLVQPILVNRLDELVIIEGAADAIARLNAAGFVCPVVTVQSGIAKGRFGESDFIGWFESFKQQLATRGATVLGPYVCPHRYRDVCDCRKPNRLLYERAAREHGLELAGSYVIGDRAADVEAASRLGGTGILVQSGWGADAREVARALPFARHVAPSVIEAVDWILVAQARRSG